MVRAHQILPQRGDHSIRAGAADAAAETRVEAEPRVLAETDVLAETGVLVSESRSDVGAALVGRSCVW